VIRAFKKCIFVYNKNMWKKILVISAFIVISILILYLIRYFLFALCLMFLQVCVKNVFFITIAMMIYFPIYCLYRVVFKIKDEQGHVPFYSRRWFIKLVCGFITIAFDLFFIHPLFNGFKHLYIERTLIVFVTIYILFILYVGAFELVYWEK